MSTTPVVIQVTDSVATTIAPNIKAIGVAARESYSAIEQLKASLKSLDANNVSKIVADLNKVTAATAQSNAKELAEVQSNEQRKLTIRELGQKRRLEMTLAYAKKINAAERDASAVNRADRLTSSDARRAFSQVSSSKRDQELQQLSEDVWTAVTKNIQTSAKQIIVGNKQASKPANFDDYVKQNWDSVLNSNSSRGHEPTAMRNLTESWNIRTGEVVDYEKALQKMMGTQTQVAASSTQLAQATQPVAAAVKQSAESTKQLASASSEAGPAMQPVNEQLLKQVQTSMALKGAQKELNVSYKNLKDAQSIFGQSAAQGNKQAQEAIASYEKEAIAAQMKVNVLKEEASAYKTVGKAAHESVPPMMAGSAALRIFEGNWGTSVRAAERFLVTTLKLGPVLQAAFPIFGAMALIGALDMMFENVKKLIEAFKSLDVEQQRTATNAVLAGERIIKAQKESFISASNFARLLAGVPGGPEDVKVSNFQANLRELSLQQDIQKAKTEANIQGLTGAAQQKARISGIEEELNLAKQQVETAKKLRDEYRRQLDETVKYTRVVYDAASKQSYTYEAIVPKISDPKQRKAIEDQLRNAIGAVGNTDIKGADGKPLFSGSNAQMGELNANVSVLEQRLRGAKLAEPSKEMADQTKAAREQMKQFNTEWSDFRKKLGHPVTYKETQDFWNARAIKALPQNKPEVENKGATAYQAIQRQEEMLKQTADMYKEAADNIGLYSDALRIAHEIQKVEHQLRREGIELGRNEVQGIKDNIQYSVGRARYQSQLASLYEEMNGPQETYFQTLLAVNKLQQDGSINSEQAVQAMSVALNNYRNAVAPMAEYNRQLDNELKLTNEYGTALRIETELMQVDEQLRQRRGKGLDSAERAALKQKLTDLDRQRLVQDELNGIYQQTTGAVERLTAAQIALARAFDDELISAQQYSHEMLNLRKQQAELNVETGKATGSDFITSVFSDQLKSAIDLQVELKDLYKGTVNELSDGVANSLGRALVYSDDLGESLKDVARQGLSQLISGMIRLGIQMALTKIIGETVGNAAVASSTAQAAATAAAWAPAAAFASLATLGANAIPADTALSTTVGLATALSFLRFAQGGLVPGSGNTDSVPALLTPGERVLTRDENRVFGPAVEAMRRGSGTGSASSVGNSNVNINVQHDGSTAVRVDQISANEIRIIAKQEALNAVHTHAPAVIASDIANPNSRTSKAMARNTTARRNR